MGSIDFEGRRVPIEEGDTVASALYRAGVRTFTRSIKHHRRRGLYCLTGDCPNCLVTVDGDPGVRSCCTAATDGIKVRREGGRPSTERDLLSVTDRMHWLLPVGFYYKTFVRPRFAWPVAERMIRSATGLGKLPVDRKPELATARHVHTDVLVVGGGVAGLAAAIAAAERGDAVTLCDEGAIGEKVAPGPTLDAIRSLRGELPEAVTMLERHTALGVYEGPLVPLVGEGSLVQVHPDRIVVATGAVERHPVFRGNDLPGIFLGRGAARLAGVHEVRPGDRATFVAGTEEAREHLRTLLEAGVEIVAVLASDQIEVPAGLRVHRGTSLAAARGRKHVTGVVLDSGERIACDAVVLSLGLSPRDGLLRMADDLPVVGAGDVVAPGCALGEAIDGGHRAGAGDVPAGRSVEPPPAGSSGYVCLCEDVSVEDLRRAWAEGWRSSEILKRYTTATMGPCQGAMCGRHLARFATEHAGASPASAMTTARPPVRPVRLEDLAGSVDEAIEKRTALHDRHVELGAKLDWSGSWKRPFNYGDVEDEYRAVRERVSLMDVSTLGKFLVAGRDAQTLVDGVFPCRIGDLEPGRSRYLLALDEAGYVMDDGLVCALENRRYFVTSTSGGADAMEAWLRNWTDRWGLHVHLVNQTAMLGAILVAGPRSRELVTELTNDAVDKDALPYMAHREISVAGVPCRALRVGFVGELCFELHHPRSRSVELWDALMAVGADLGIRPHGLDALEILRMEKGHIYLAQDTLPDDHPRKLGLSWAVAMDKPSFVGRTALQRMLALPQERKLVGLTFEREAPLRGVPLHAGDRIVGRVTSYGRSLALGQPIGLGWLRAIDGVFPTQLRAGDVPATVTQTPFYDPEGARLRA